MGVSTIHGAESFYEFLRPSHRERKLLFVMEVLACVLEHKKFKEKLKEKLVKTKLEKMFCLGHCYENNAFHYDGENYAGKDIEKIDDIISGKKLTKKNFFQKFCDNKFFNG